MATNRDNAQSPFLGRGWGFPPAFGHGGGQVATVAGAEDVRQSLEIIFATEVGERVMRETFGSNLRQFVFEEVDRTLFGRIRTAVTDAILDHEPRIRLESVEIAESAETVGLLLVSLHFTIRSTNSRYNMVYPFYTKEASARAS